MFFNEFPSYISASCSLGAAQASIEAAVDYVKVRKQFSEPIASFQVLYNVSCSGFLFSVDIYANLNPSKTFAVCCSCDFPVLLEMKIGLLILLKFWVSSGGILAYLTLLHILWVEIDIFHLF